MNLLAHFAYVVLLDYFLFWYWYEVANRYDVLNFNETAFLPGRYIMSGLLAGVVVFWAYLIPVVLLRRFAKGYWHPRWYLLWIAAGTISGLQVFQLLRDPSDPLVTIETALAAVIHLQLVHLVMFRIANAYMNKGRRLILPGVFTAILFLADWLFWLWYSFNVPLHVSRPDEPVPVIGSALERYLIGIFVLQLLVFGVVFNLRVRISGVDWKQVVIPIVDITIEEILYGFFSAWTLFYLIVPISHYLIRGYILAHSTLFPAFFLGMFIPVIWSLFLMWPIILANRPALWRSLPHAYEQVKQWRESWSSRG